MERQFLSEHPLFRRVPPDLLQELTAGSEVCEIGRGKTAYERHSFRRCLGILMTGRLRVKKENLVVSTLRAGDVFGAAALFNEEEDYPTTLTALEDCRLLLIPQEEVRKLVFGCGAFAEDYISYLSGRIRFLSSRLDTVSAERGEGKLARYLLSAENGTGQMTLSATQICQQIGIGRATLYRAFEVLEQAGAISRCGKTIRTIDVKKLRSFGACE